MYQKDTDSPLYSHLWTNTRKLSRNENGDSKKVNNICKGPKLLTIYEERYENGGCLMTESIHAHVASMSP